MITTLVYLFVCWVYGPSHCNMDMVVAFASIELFLELLASVIIISVAAAPLITATIDNWERKIKNKR